MDHTRIMSSSTKPRAKRNAPCNSSIVFIDLSNYIFHRYFAMKRWMKLSQTEFATEQDMLARFRGLFVDHLVKFQKKLKFDWKNLYMACDCPRDTIWRMALFPEYKKKREERVIDFNPIVFPYTYDNILPELVTNHGIKIIDCPNAEADDIVAVMHKCIRQANPEQPVIIITNDNDYLQLHDGHTTILNCNMLNIAERFTPEILSNFATWKSIRGDDSDNIPPIDKKIGDKTALKLATDHTFMKDKFRTHPEAEKQFNLNRRLIDFECIPSDIANRISQFVPATA